MRSRPAGLLAILTALAVMLAVLGLTLLGIYLYVQARPQLAEPTSQDPWLAANTMPVAPALTVRTLAGEDPVVTVRSAHALDDLNTAWQLIALDPTLTDAERSGHLLLLARALAEDGRKADAETVLTQAELISILSPSLSDVVRVEAALSLSSIWQFMGARDEAASALSTAALIIDNSNSLRSAQRRDLWSRLTRAYDDLDLPNDIEAPSASPKTASSMGSVVNLQLQLEYPLIPYPLPADLAELRNQRQLRAVRLIEQWMAQGGGDVGPEAADLAEFLIREDQALSVHLVEAIASAPELRVRAAAAWELVSWQSCKYRVAVGGYGLSLVPQWEEDAPLIRSDLAKAYEELLRVLGDRITALPDASMVEPGRLALSRYGILLGEMDLYPDYPRKDLIQRLLTNQELTSSASSGYLIDAQLDGDRWRFSLRASDSR